MKKIILSLLLITSLTSCVDSVLNKNQYTIIDTVSINKNNVGVIQSYNVIVKFENGFYVSHLYRGELTDINLKCKIDTSRLK